MIKVSLFLVGFFLCGVGCAMISPGLAVLAVGLDFVFMSLVLWLGDAHEQSDKKKKSVRLRPSNSTRCCTCSVCGCDDSLGEQQSEPSGAGEQQPGVDS